MPSTEIAVLIAFGFAVVVGVLAVGARPIPVGWRIAAILIIFGMGLCVGKWWLNRDPERPARAKPVDAGGTP